MKPLKDWIDTDVAELKKVSGPEYYDEKFHRDPVRNQLIDSSVFYSPADGTVLYSKIVNPEDQILEVKGKNYSLKDIMQRDIGKKCLVVGIFLSQYDVHILRLPYSGVARFQKLDKIESHNRPMLANENDILRGIVDQDNLDYVYTNERFIDSIYSGFLGYEYYMVSIADDDIDVVAHHYEQNSPLLQNKRIATIKWGSQCDLILPLDDRYTFRSVVPEGYHVEAGVDPLVRIRRKEETRREVRRNLSKLISLSVRKSDPVKSTVKHDGIPIALEWLNGEERHWKGSPYRNPMVGTNYGYVENTIDGDGEEVDVYLAEPVSEGAKVYMMSQLRKDGTFDEHKFFLGFDSIDAAKKAYLAAMPKEMMGEMVEMSMDDFKNKYLKFHVEQNTREVKQAGAEASGPVMVVNRDPPFEEPE